MALTLIKSHTELKNEVARILGIVAVSTDAGSTRTQQQVAEEIGRILGAYGVGESSLPTADDDVIDDMIEDTILDLYNRGLFTQTTSATIPQDEATHLAKICAAKLAQVYAQPLEETAALMQEVPRAEANLYRLQLNSDTIISDRITEMLMELSREGLIMFDVTDTTAIDISSFRSIAEITAASLVDVFQVGEQKAQRLIIMSEAARDRLKRMVFDGVNDDVVETDYF